MSSRGRILDKYEEEACFKMPFLKGLADSVGVRIDRAQEELLQMRQRSEAIERDAYEKGFESGERAGVEMGQRKAAVLIGRLEQMIAEFTAFREDLMKGLEPQLIELGGAIAERILAEELKLRPEAIINIVKEALKKIEKSGTVLIKINPSLNELFIKMKPELLEMHPDVVFEVDASIPPTGPLVIGQKEEVPTEIGSQVANIVEELRG